MPFDPTSITDHPVQALLLGIRGDLQSAEQAEGLPQTDITTLSRMKAVVANLIDRFAATDPFFLSVGTLGNLHTHLQRLQVLVQAYLSGRAQAQLEEANAYLDQQVTPWLAQIPTDIRVDGTTGQSKAAAEYHSAVVRNLDALSAAVVKLDDLGKSTRDSLDKTLTRADAMRAEIDQIVSNFRQSYGEFQSGLRGQFDEAMKAFQTEQAEAKQRHDREHTSEIDTLRERSASLLKTLEDRKADAERIVESIGTTGLTGNYKRIAEAERSSANITRFLSVLFMVAGLAVIGWALHDYRTSYDIESAVLRIVFGLAFSAPAVYLGHESSKHRLNEIRARKVELELAALGPFIVQMPEGKQMEIRDKLVDRFFGQPLADQKVDLPPNMLSFAKDIVQALTKLK